MHPVALTGSSGLVGPQLGGGTQFAGFNGFPSIGASGEIAYPGDITSTTSGISEGFWLNDGVANKAIVLINNDGALGPGLGGGITFENTFHDALNGAPGSVLLGGFLAGQGVDASNNLLYALHLGAGGNLPVARTGVDNSLGPGLGERIVFDQFYGSQISAADSVLVRATVSGEGIGPGVTEGVWRHTFAGNVAIALSGREGSLGPGLGAGVSFNSGGFPIFEQYQVFDDSGAAVFVGRTKNAATAAEEMGLWKNRGSGNLVFALSGMTNHLGPGLGPSLAFGGPQQIPPGFLQFDANSHGAVAFFTTLADGRRGLWRNLEDGNQPLMLVGQTGALGPGPGIQDTFANFTTSQLIVQPAINEDNAVLFPGRLSNSRQQGLWLNDGSGNRAIALTGDSGAFGPGFGPGITFAGFNRAYFGAADTVYFTADLTPGVAFNRLLGLWAYRDGKITPIAVYNELFDVDPTEQLDERRVEWVQIPSDFTYNNDYGANRADQLVFRMGFFDGSQGIFALQHVPEPSSLAAALLLAAAGSATLRRSRLMDRSR
jgi:hypothetical protein